MLLDASWKLILRSCNRPILSNCRSPHNAMPESIYKNVGKSGHIRKLGQFHIICLSRIVTIRLHDVTPNNGDLKTLHTKWYRTSILHTSVGEDGRCPNSHPWSCFTKKWTSVKERDTRKCSRQQIEVTPCVRTTQITPRRPHRLIVPRVVVTYNAMSVYGTSKRRVATS